MDRAFMGFSLFPQASRRVSFDKADRDRVFELTTKLVQMPDASAGLMAEVRKSSAWHATMCNFSSVGKIGLNYLSPADKQRLRPLIERFITDVAKQAARLQYAERFGIMPLIDAKDARTLILDRKGPSAILVQPANGDPDRKFTDQAIDTLGKINNQLPPRARFALGSVLVPNFVQPATHYILNSINQMGKIANNDEPWVVFYNGNRAWSLSRGKEFAQNIQLSGGRSTQKLVFAAQCALQKQSMWG